MRRLLVLYGSQTGTAQDVAEQIWRESKKLGFIGPVLALDEYVIQNLIEEQLVIFVVSTTGNGDEPDNMKESWKFLLRRNLSSSSLEKLRFACLGLGDSSYDKFNYAAKKLNRRLQNLGAISLCPIGLADDQHEHGFGAIALPWITELWSSLRKEFSIPAAYINDAPPLFKWNVQILDQDVTRMDVNHFCWQVNKTQESFVLVENKRTTAEDHFQEVRLLRFNFSTGINWYPGDSLEVQPSNSEELVSSFFSLVEEHKLDFNFGTVVQLKKNYDDMPLPKIFQGPITIGYAVKYIWDLSAKPRQRFFELLAQNCVDQLEVSKLLEFSTIEGLNELINYIYRPRRTIMEVLQDFPCATSKLTLNVLFELMPTIQARRFSIASNYDKENTLDLLVAVVNYKTKLLTPRLGLCSNWLKIIKPGTTIYGKIRPSTITLPSNLLTPLIFVGPGTGIAPFRSVIQNRLQLKNLGAEIGVMVVFFGCRNASKDFHFAEDFYIWQKSNFVKVFIAYSRDQNHKIYVQHRIKEAAGLLADLIKNQNANVYVCGSSKNIPKAVKEAFIEVLAGDTEYIEKMVKLKRYQEETWS